MGGSGALDPLEPVPGLPGALPVPSGELAHNFFNLEPGRIPLPGNMISSLILAVKFRVSILTTKSSLVCLENVISKIYFMNNVLKINLNSTCRQTVYKSRLNA